MNEFLMNIVSSVIIKTYGERDNVSRHYIGINFVV